MPAPYSTRHPARNNLFGTIRLFFHAPYGHLFPSPPRTMAPHTGFQILSHEQLSLARTHPASQATSVPPAISAQGRIQTSTRTSSHKKDRNKTKGTGENAIHEANTITDTHPASQWPLSIQQPSPKPFLHPCHGNPAHLALTLHSHTTLCHCEEGRSPDAAIERNHWATHRIVRASRTTIPLDCHARLWLAMTGRP
jgi:hypothetical protein